MKKVRKILILILLSFSFQFLGLHSQNLKKQDSISYVNYMNARKIEKIKYYMSICEKKPKNKKFLYGWIKRTLSQK